MSGKLTDESIRKTFMELLEQKSFSKITVKDISERVGINRQTFYYHYRDIVDLASSIIIDMCKDCFRPENDLSTCLMEIYDVMMREKTIVLNIVRSKNYDSLRLRLEPDIKRIMDGLVDRIPSTAMIPRQKRDFVVSYYAVAISSLILRWIQEGMDMDRTFFHQLSLIIQSNLENTVSILRG